MLLPLDLFGTRYIYRKLYLDNLHHQLARVLNNHLGYEVFTYTDYRSASERSAFGGRWTDGVQFTYQNFSDNITCPK
jgi:hypothetical protein